MQYVLNYNSLQVWSLTTIQVRVFSLHSASFILCRGCQNTTLLKAVFFYGHNIFGHPENVWPLYTYVMKGS